MLLWVSEDRGLGERAEDRLSVPKNCRLYPNCGRAGFPACEEERTVNEWGTNQRIRPQTADGRPRNGRWTVDRGRWHGRLSGLSGRANRQRMGNESTNQTADRGRQTANQGGQTVNEWGTNQRIRPRTADGRPPQDGLSSLSTSFGILVIGRVFFRIPIGIRAF